MLSARHQFEGTVKSVKLASVMAEVAISVNVTGVIKATDVMIDK